MFKIIYILTIIYYWLSFAAGYTEIKRMARKKVITLRRFAINCMGKPPKLSSPNIPAVILALFKGAIYSLIPIWNICVGYAYTKEDFKTEMANKLSENYKKNYADWLAENNLEQEFIEYTQGG